MKWPRVSRDELRLWRLQVAALVRQELQRLRQPAGIGLFVIAVLPAVFILMHVLFDRGRDCRVARETEVLAGLFQFYLVRVGLFMGCLSVFGGMFRREVMQKTLHHLFLAPARREVLVVGKFAGAWLSVFLLYACAWLLATATMYGHSGPAGWEYVRHGPALLHFASYIGILALGTLGFGAVFLAVGLTFRNPTVPAVVLLAAESFGSLLPGWLQRLTVTFYLKPLLPLPLAEEGPAAFFSFVADPVPPAVAVLGMLSFALLVLVLACWRVRRFDVNYSTE